MQTKFLLIASVLTLMSAAGRCEVPSTTPPLACADPNSPDVETCVAKQGKLATEKLMPVYKATVTAANQACSDLPEPAIGACLEKALSDADHALNEAYKKTSAYIDESSLEPADANKWKAQLKTAQERWTAFRDADCGALTESEYMHGTGAGAAAEHCQLSMTLMRAEEIKSRYSDR